LSWLGQHHEGDDAIAVGDMVALDWTPYEGWMGLGALTSADQQAIEQGTELLMMQRRLTKEIKSK